MPFQRGENSVYTSNRPWEQSRCPRCLEPEFINVCTLWNVESDCKDAHYFGQCTFGRLVDSMDTGNCSSDSFSVATPSWTQKSHQYLATGFVRTLFIPVYFSGGGHSCLEHRRWMPQGVFPESGPSVRIWRKNVPQPMSAGGHRVFVRVFFSVSWTHTPQRPGREWQWTSIRR